MRCLRTAVIGTAALWLSGCQWLPEQPFASAPAPESEVTACVAEVPDFTPGACLLPDWVAFGLASQRGDRQWRDGMLARLDGTPPVRRLARAAVLGWGSEREWDRASELYKADLHAAPAALQPLLRYWLNELEGRRALAGRLGEARHAQATLEGQNHELLEKLEALTAIERNINLRQHAP